MDPRTAQFIVFIAFLAGCLVAGYSARRTGWLHENHSRKIHLLTVIVLWPMITLISVWGMRIEAQDIWLLVIPTVQVAIGAYVAIPVCRLFRLSRNHTGVILIASGLGNLGFTMGAYLAYCILHPAEQALAYGIAFVTIMQVAMVPLVYPLARRYGSLHKGDEPLGKLIVNSFVDLRAMPLYAAVIGLILGSLEVPRAAFLTTPVFLNAIIYLGGAGAVVGIGMRLRLGDALRYPIENLVLAIMRFIVLPAATLGLISLIGLTPLPLSSLLREVSIIEAFVPTALLTVMLSNIFHLDTRLASSAWLVNTIVFLVVPLPVLLWWFG